MTSNPIRFIGLAAIAAALLAGGYWWGHAQQTSAKGSTPSERKVMYWYDTMVPDQHFDHPGLSPMGMQMVPKYADEAATNASVRIDPRTAQNLGVRTAVVEKRVLALDVSAPATVNWDLNEASVVSARVDAVITHLHVRAPFTPVAAGAPLTDVLAPQWSEAIAEQAALAHAQSDEARSLHVAAGDRLRLLGLSDADRHAMHAGAITLHALQAGVVTTLDVRESQRVNAGQTLMTINGTAKVWVEATLPQALAPSVRAGSRATVTLDALPGRTINASVEAVLPDVDAMTRTQRVRLVVDNRDGSLSPGMFAHVRFASTAGEALPLVPTEALITTGTQTRVIVDDGNGHFRPVVVGTGRSADGYTQILSGLNGGERIVVSGQFLIDSEASVSGALERLGSDAKERAP
ncbi:MAG: efflux RND transporter periplasmic adaptor subunit [Proteobacteria bacterium]|nr:efflux RND transporter periplasmic adaptor subunit [Pseudomonadota bacterium]